MKYSRPTYTVFDSSNNRNAVITDPRMWFDLNNNNYIFVDQDYVGTVDFFILGDYNSSVKIDFRQRLKLAIWHGSEDFVRHQCNRRDCRVITNGWDPTIDNEHIIFNDFLFNRTKACYSQYPWSPDTQLWYYQAPEAYKSLPVVKADSKKKIFVCPGKTYNGTRKYRTKLISKLRSYDDTLGYLSNWDDNPDLFLFTELQTLTHSIEELKKNTPADLKKTWGYSPPSSQYYQNTFISIYGESIEYGNTIMITEKTWDPLIKGHFILPFSCCNFIKRLRDIGVLFPTFIDYSYDAEPDNERRWQLYSDEIDRLLTMDLDTWHQHWNDNLDLLLANQRYFHARDYDRVDLAKLLE
jgi:hypothetical protein